ncbi:MAG TPA: hypothetical protein VGH19_19495 [Verrucomicrobiae bacterium]
MNFCWHVCWLFLSGLLTGWTAEFTLPPRAADALKGSEIVSRIEGLDLAAREQFIEAQVQLGNVPDYWRRFATVEIVKQLGGQERRVAYQVAPDYLALGSDADYFLAPISPQLAQTLADEFGWMLPTRQMVNDIYTAAPLKLVPTSIAPSEAMTTVPVFQQYNETVRSQRLKLMVQYPLGSLVAGHKKDVVITPRLAASPGKVAIYGWHQAVGKPIQPLYLGHADVWIDYSHGIRFVQRTMLLDGVKTMAESVLADAGLAALLSDEGVFKTTRYEVLAKVKEVSAPQTAVAEKNETITFDPGVRVVINSPALLATNKPVRLIFYALPNGNTIEQTIGRKLKPGDDWHFDIQHIGAQMRWLRAQETNVNWVIAYFENADKSWPTWRRKNDPDNKRIRGFVESVQARYPKARLVLTGHSGGGSFMFGYLNGLERIPDEVERIAFLDSNYAYNAAQDHAGKLTAWLKGGTRRYLCVLAYHDSIALLNGKTFVSESGGTWGRSHAMLKDLGTSLSFEKELTANWQRHTALDGRVKFILRENPEKAVLHTRQVEWNGFIHAMLMGTALESKGYEYFGPRAYGELIAEE